MAWPPPGMPHLEVAFPAFNTDVLIASGMVAHLALVSYRRGQVHTLPHRRWPSPSCLGAAFLIGQVWEYTHVGFGLSRGSWGPRSSRSPACTACTSPPACCCSATCCFRSFRDERMGLVGGTRGSAGMMAAGTYYWHFVDVVWVVIFVVVYLL